MAGDISHDRLQSECWQYLWNMYPQTRKLCWHTPNEQRPYPGETKKEYIIRLSQAKAIGVVKGVVDLVFYWKGVLHIFDIKIGNDSLSEDQKLFIKAVVAQGGVFYEIRTLEQFIKIIITLQIQ